MTPGRSIEFREVFQNGMDAVKYKIVQFPYDTGHWYILECKDCDKIFTANPPLSEAELHLNIEHLAHASTTPELTIQRFGTRVLHCTAELARSNNNACKRVPGVVNSAGPQTTSQPTRTPSRGRPKKKAKMKPYQWESPKSYNELKPEVLNPQPGDIFACWQKPKGFYPVMIVPWGRFERFDFVHTLQHRVLMRRSQTATLKPKRPIRDPDRGQRVTRTMGCGPTNACIPSSSSTRSTFREGAL